MNTRRHLPPCQRSTGRVGTRFAAWTLTSGLLWWLIWTVWCFAAGLLVGLDLG